jgi:peroxiredoxin
MAQNEPEAAFKQSLAVVEEFENDEIRNYSRFNAMNTRLMWEGLEGFNQHLVYFKKHNTDNHYRKQLDLAYAKKYTLAPGQAAPDFELPNANNETKSLKDFRGQYVLIDFWNTRCSICMREMPYFKKIQSEFENENIAFVSISNDPDPERWKAFVKDQKDFGTDLRTENFWDSEVFRAYQVNGTPTYVLVDPAGIIINPMAPKPSTPELKKLLASVLNTQ